jgi:serine/threonine-protein kinase RsbW
VIWLKLPGRLRYRDLAVRVVAAACKLVGGEAELAATAKARDFDDEVVSAFGEAFNNIAQHGYRDRMGDVEIKIDPTLDQIQIRIEDFGTSFDPGHAPSPDLDALPESGMGIFIMRSFVDEVSYRPGHPNVLVLTKRLVR